jgi:hypothetical protein
MIETSTVKATIGGAAEDASAAGRRPLRPKYRYCPYDCGIKSPLRDRGALPVRRLLRADMYLPARMTAA